MNPAPECGAIKSPKTDIYSEAPHYRSTRHIIEAANTVIEPARDRMKVDHEIHIDKARAKDAAGGPCAGRDPVAGGRVQVLPAGHDAISQAQAAVAELQRLAGLESDWDWSACAVIAREWAYLEPVRSLCALEGIPVQMANEELPSVWHLRETQTLLGWLRKRDSRLVRNADLREWLSRQSRGPWIELLQEAVEEHEVETGAGEAPVDSFVEWLAEWGREVRRRQRGLLLLTAHRAKGLEFDHVVVIDGGWDRAGHQEDPDARRRLYYVAMTRARRTLTLGRLPGSHPIQDALRDSSSVLWRESVTFPPPAPELARRYRSLTLSDVYLSFAGHKSARDRVHRAIAALSPGDRLRVRPQSDRWALLDGAGGVVGTLARGFEPPPGMRCADASVLAVVSWNRDRSEPQYQKRLLCDRWEVVVPELVFKPS